MEILLCAKRVLDRASFFHGHLGALTLLRFACPAFAFDANFYPRARSDGSAGKWHLLISRTVARSRSSRSVVTSADDYCMCIGVPAILRSRGEVEFVRSALFKWISNNVSGWIGKRAISSRRSVECSQIFSEKHSHFATPSYFPQILISNTNTRRYYTLTMIISLFIP